MAKEDFYGGTGKNNVSGSEDSNTARDYRTANERVSETVYVGPDSENKAEATAAGVQDAAFIDYDEALTALAAREDMESFDSYTRRSHGLTGASFTAGEHMRELPNRSGGNGIAADPGNAIVDPDGSGSGAS